MVPYGIMSDFYFSGHSGFMVLNICERWVQDKDKRLVIIYTIFLVYIMIVLITFRVHYIIGKVL